MAQNKQTKADHSDKNLALISVILGATSFTNTIFTGIPAIIVGIIALKRNAGDRTQAKLGIILGAIGSLLLIPIIVLAVHFLREPLREQWGLPETDRTALTAMADNLYEYKKAHGNYPQCTALQTASECTDWQSFLREYNIVNDYTVEFEDYFSQVEDRAIGTLVYVKDTACFINTPTHPGYIDDEEKVHAANYAALVYFHEKGRSCFSALEP